MAYVYLNPNPLDKHNNDCVVRAIALSRHKTWDEIYKDLCKEGYEMADMPSSNAVWDRYLRKHGYTRHYLSDTCPDCYTLKDFCEDYPDGEYIVCTGEHAVCVVYSDHLDITDSSNEIVTYYYEKEF